MNSPKKIFSGHILGNLSEMKNEGVGFYTRMNREHGDAIEARIGWKKFYVFFHPDHIREVLSDKADIFVKGEQYNQLRHLLGDGLLTSAGPEWEKQRRLLNPIFGKAGLDILLKLIQKSSKEFNENLLSEVEIDWTKSMFDFSLSVAMSSFFGSNLNQQKMDQMAADTHTCMRFVSKRMTGVFNLPLFLPTREHKKFKLALNHIRSEVERIYDEKKLFNKNETNEVSDLLDLLISAQDEDKYKLSKAQVFDQVMSFLIAGHETTAITMGWLFFLLAKNPHYQDVLIKEFEKNNYEFNSSSSLSEYPFLEAVISETMRLYPAGWIIARNSLSDNSVGGLKVKSGRVVAVCPYVAHRDSRWWSQADKFWPERFLDKVFISNLPKGAYVPFSMGKRNCIGARFSQIEIMVFTIDFFKKFKVTTKQDFVGVKGFVTLKTDRPIKLILSKR
jgi:cytochrome P450